MRSEVNGRLGFLTPELVVWCKLVARLDVALVTLAIELTSCSIQPHSVWCGTVGGHLHIGRDVASNTVG